MPVELVFTMRGARVIMLGRQRWRFTVGEPHFHSCPNCYEHEGCVEDCEFVPVLSEDEMGLYGSHVLCDECAFEVKERQG